MSRFHRTHPTPRYAACRKALRGTAVNVPAELLSDAAAALWVRRRGLGVDVSTAEELQLVLAAGLPAARVLAQCPDVDAVSAAVAAGVGRYVIGRWSQVLLVAGCGPSQRVLIDVTEPAGERLATSVMALAMLDVVGLRCRIGGDGAQAVDALTRLIEMMARLRRAHGVILTRASLSGYGRGDADSEALRRGVRELQLTAEESCARLRYPRPALMLSLDAATLVAS
jgi:hypothetical protein